jgi:hypothetical protein
MPTPRKNSLVVYSLNRIAYLSLTYRYDDRIEEGKRSG